MGLLDIVQLLQLSDTDVNNVYSSDPDIISNILKEY